MDRLKEFNEYIAVVKRCGAGIYGTTHFMCIKDEHWKFLAAFERIAELEAQVAFCQEANGRQYKMITELEGNTDGCMHLWVSANNEVVSGAKICLKCKTTEADTDDQA